MAELWQVVAQQQTTDLQPDGRILDVMRVSFVTRSGVYSSVNVPWEKYEPEVVAALIDEQAHLIESVHALES